MRALRIVSLRGVPLLLAAAFAPACGGDDGTGPEVASGPDLLAIGVARQDLSTEAPAEGFLALFFDREEEVLLDAEVRINDTQLTQTIEPGIVAGPIFFQGVDVRSGESYRLEAVVLDPAGAVNVSSTPVLVPDRFEVRGPANHPLGEPLPIEWDPVGNSEGFVVSIQRTGFEAELAGSATSFTVPESAFEGLEPRDLEIEVTAFNNFFVSISGGIDLLQRADELAAQFGEADNVDGAIGAFGAATTAGIVVTLQ